MTIPEIEAALEARETLIAALLASPPSPDLLAHLTAALDSGNSLHLALQALKLRLTSESHRLTQIQTGLLAGLGSSPDPQIDYRA